MVRKLILSILLVLSSASLFAVSGGWAVSGSGQAGIDEGTSLNIALQFDPTDKGYLTAEGAFRLGFGEDASWGFEGFTLSILSAPFGFLNHPLNFLFTDRTIWAPEAGAGISTSRELDIYYNLRFSPLHFRDASFTYDILAPYVYFDRGFDYAGWGIELMKVGYYF